jgi:transglutaminase-like putative cysteine protease
MMENAPTVPARRFRAPPFLLLAALLFWGWQEGFFLAGAVMGVVLESARWLKARLEVTEQDFRRIWSFCALLVLALLVFAFGANQTGGGLGGMLRASTETASRYLDSSAANFLRWLPMALILLVAAQVFSERGSVPLSAISWFIRRRRKTGAGGEQYWDVSYPYFILCLLCASIHPNQGTQSYYWGQAALLAWALWPLRSRRFGAVAWAGALAAAVGLGFLAQRGMGDLRKALQNLDESWMAGLFAPRTDASQNLTAIGRIGRLKLSARIVIRLDTKTGGRAPTYLREAGYRQYYPQQATWSSGGTRNDFTGVPADPADDTSWTLLRGGANTQVVTIASYLDGRSRETGNPEGLLPLPSGSRRLEKLPVNPLKTNQTGAVLASGPGLVIFDARYAAGATFDAPPDPTTNRWDLTVPGNEVPALDQIISGLKLSGQNEERKLLAVQQFFASNFSYSTWLGPDKAPRANETALARFLLQSRSGHCEYFATATVLLLREMGIPARYAVGYAVHETSGHGYVVRERDAHAWCLVWNEAKKTWEDFDTTPGSWVAAESQRASVLDWFWDFWSGVRFQIAKLRWGRTNLRQYILWGLVPVLGLLLYQILFRRGRGRRRQPKTGESAAAMFRPGLDSEFYELERQLAARGVPRQPGETLSDWLARALADPALADLRQAARQLLPLHYAHRFDPRGLTGPDRKTLAREAKKWAQFLRTRAPRRLTGTTNPAC